VSWNRRPSGAFFQETRIALLCSLLAILLGVALCEPNLWRPSSLKYFPPVADALLAKCGDLVKDDMLVEISRADLLFKGLTPARRKRAPVSWRNYLVTVEAIEHALTPRRSPV
jgi:hypothetical protein